MHAEVHFVRRQGIKIPERDSRGISPLKGTLTLGHRWVSDTKTLPALELHESSPGSERGLLAILFEPRLTSMHSNWMRFNGYEVLQIGDARQLVIQEWRCYIRP